MSNFCSISRETGPLRKRVPIENLAKCQVAEVKCPPRLQQMLTRIKIIPRTCVRAHPYKFLAPISKNKIYACHHRCANFILPISKKYFLAVLYIHAANFVAVLRIHYQEIRRSVPHIYYSILRSYRQPYITCTACL